MSSARNSHDDTGPLERVLGRLVSCGRFLLLLLVVPVFLVFFKQPQSEHEQVQETLEELAVERLDLAGKLDRLKRQEQWIRNDPAYLQLAARDARDRQKPDEIILRLE